MTGPTRWTTRTLCCSSCGRRWRGRFRRSSRSGCCCWPFSSSRASSSTSRSCRTSCPTHPRKRRARRSRHSRRGRRRRTAGRLRRSVRWGRAPATRCIICVSARHVRRVGSAHSEAQSAALCCCHRCSPAQPTHRCGACDALLSTASQRLTLERLPSAFSAASSPCMIRVRVGRLVEDDRRSLVASRPAPYSPHPGIPMVR